jgi:defect-in-organelle-trafficking protein DotC
MKKIFFLCLALSLTACASNKTVSAESGQLNDLRRLSTGTLASSDQVSGIRYAALRDAALSLGARAGLAAQAKELNNMLSRHDRLLSRVFNFQQLLLDENVMPPVLMEGRNTLDMKNYDTIRASDRVYAIYRQAHFVSAAPTWRDYLHLQYKQPETPDRSLLPRNKAERLIWEHYIEDGWKAGNEQADNIFTESLGRLSRDFVGMLRYRSLLAQNMVSAPFVATLDLGVTGSDSELVVNDRILRITEMPTFTKNPGEWNSEVTPEAIESDNDMRY